MRHKFFGNSNSVILTYKFNKTIFLSSSRQLSYSKFDCSTLWCIFKSILNNIQNHIWCMNNILINIRICQFAPILNLYVFRFCNICNDIINTLNSTCNICWTFIKNNFVFFKSWKFKNIIYKTEQLIFRLFCLRNIFKNKFAVHQIWFNIFCIFNDFLHRIQNILSNIVYKNIFCFVGLSCILGNLFQNKLFTFFFSFQVCPAFFFSNIIYEYIINITVFFCFHKTAIVSYILYFTWIVFNSVLNKINFIFRSNLPLNFLLYTGKIIFMNQPLKRISC